MGRVHKADSYTQKNERSQNQFSFVVHTRQCTSYDHPIRLRHSWSQSIPLGDEKLGGEECLSATAYGASACGPPAPHCLLEVSESGATCARHTSSKLVAKPTTSLTASIFSDKSLPTGSGWRTMQFEGLCMVYCSSLSSAVGISTSVFFFFFLLLLLLLLLACLPLGPALRDDVFFLLLLFTSLLVVDLHLDENGPRRCHEHPLEVSI